MPSVYLDFNIRVGPAERGGRSTFPQAPYFLYHSHVHMHGHSLGCYRYRFPADQGAWKGIGGGGGGVDYHCMEMFP